MRKGMLLFAFLLVLSSSASDARAQAAPTTQADTALIGGAPVSVDTPTEGVSVGTTTTDSYNKEVGGKVSIYFDQTKAAPGWKTPLDGKHSWCSKENTFNLISGAANYDDKWKDALSASNVTHTYSLLQVTQAKVFGKVPLGELASLYHSNQQGIHLDQEYGIGTYNHWGSLTPDTSSAVMKSYRLLLSGGVRGTFEREYGGVENVNRVGVGVFSQFAWVMSKPLNSASSGPSLLASFKGLAPFANPLIYGNASGAVAYSLPFTAKLALKFEISDTYYATVPKGPYRPNNFGSTISVTFNPKPKKS
jgi:hypothetical protein